MGAAIAAVISLVFVGIAVYFHMQSSTWRGDTPGITWVCTIIAAGFGLICLCMAVGVSPPLYTSTEREQLIQLCAAKPNCDLDTIMKRLEGNPDGN